MPLDLVDLVGLWPFFDEEDEDYDEFAGGPGPSSGVLPSVTYPTTRLVSRIQIALGADLSADPATWNWLDITAYVRFDLGVSLTTGRRDEASAVTTGSAMLKLDNRDGRFTRRNPNSPYYGLLSKNTPIWATVDAGSGQKTRLEMFVNEWPNRWPDKSGNDTTVTIRCAGILRRLGQGRVLKSPLRRAYLSSAQPVPVVYWPCEDEEGSATVASGLATNPTPMTGVTPHFSTGIAGSSGGLDLIATGPSTVPVAAVALPSASGFQLELSVLGDQGHQVVLFDMYTNFPSGLIRLTAVAAATDGQPHHIAYRFVQNGANVDETTYRDGVQTSTTSFAGTLISPFYLYTSPYDLDTALLATGTLVVSHVAVYGFSTMDVPTTRAPATDGYTGEQAHVRTVRLCGEEGVLCTSLASGSATMGAQSADTLLSLLSECSAADLGVLYEKRWGLAYKSRAEFYNQPVGLALDFDQGHIADLPEPADDDQRTRNLWTVSRVDGSESTFEQTTGPMGTGAAGPGVYDDAVTVNVELDTQLPEIASWLVSVGTIDEDRWPAIGLNFTRTPTIIDAWTALPFGARITAAHPPTQMPPDDLDLIIEGYSEAWDPIIWGASLNCSPASAYRVAIVSDPATIQEQPRIGSTTATLAVAISTSDVSLSVTTGADGLWTTAAADFPLDVNIEGERIRLSAISGAASPQTFTVSARSQNGIVKAHSAGASVTPWKTLRVGL